MKSVAADRQNGDVKAGAGRMRRGEEDKHRGKRLASYGQQARSLKRLLEHKKDLPEEVQAQMRETAEELQKQHRRRVKELKRQKFIRAKKALYSKLKFYELKKVQRRLQQTRKQLIDLLAKQQERVTSAAGGSKAEKQSVKCKEGSEEDTLADKIAETQQKLRLHLDDLNYIRLYPIDEPYVALFPAQDSEESRQKRNAMRLRIRELLLNSRTAEEGNDNQDAGGDDMFIDATENAHEASADVDPFEDAHDLSDEESGIQQIRDRPSLSQRSRGHLRNSQVPARTSVHKKGPAGQHRERSKCGTNRSNKQRVDQNFASGKHSAKRKDSQGEEGSQLNDTPKYPQKKGQVEGHRLAQTKPESKKEPMRIGLSKHKPANQHVIFDSDDD